MRYLVTSIVTREHIESHAEANKKLEYEMLSMARPLFPVENMCVRVVNSCVPHAWSSSLSRTTHNVVVMRVVLVALIVLPEMPAIVGFSSSCSVLHNHVCSQLNNEERSEYYCRIYPLV